MQLSKEKSGAIKNQWHWLPWLLVGHSISKQLLTGIPSSQT